METRQIVVQCERPVQMLTRDSETADIHLVVKNTRIPAHKCILAAGSPVFKAMFYGGYRESQKESLEVHINEVDADIFQYFLDFFYGAEIVIESSNFGELLKLACYYQNKSLLEHLTKVTNCFMSKDTFLFFLDLYDIAPDGIKHIIHLHIQDYLNEYFNQGLLDGLPSTVVKSVVNDVFNDHRKLLNNISPQHLRHVDLAVTFKSSGISVKRVTATDMFAQYASLLIWNTQQSGKKYWELRFPHYGFPLSNRIIVGVAQEGCCLDDAYTSELGFVYYTDTGGLFNKAKQKFVGLDRLLPDQKLVICLDMNNYRVWFKQGNLPFCLGYDSLPKGRYHLLIGMVSIGQKVAFEHIVQPPERWDTETSVIPSTTSPSSSSLASPASNHPSQSGPGGEGGAGGEVEADTGGGGRAEPLTNNRHSRIFISSRTATGMNEQRYDVSTFSGGKNGTSGSSSNSNTSSVSTNFAGYLTQTSDLINSGNATRDSFGNAQTGLRPLSSRRGGGGAFSTTAHGTSANYSRLHIRSDSTFSTFLPNASSAATLSGRRNVASGVDDIRGASSGNSSGVGLSRTALRTTDQNGSNVGSPSKGRSSLSFSGLGAGKQGLLAGVSSSSSSSLFLQRNSVPRLTSAITRPHDNCSKSRKSSLSSDEDIIKALRNRESYLSPSHPLRSSSSLLGIDSLSGASSSNRCKAVQSESFSSSRSMKMRNLFPSCSSDNGIKYTSVSSAWGKVSHSSDAGLLSSRTTVATSGVSSRRLHTPVLDSKCIATLGTEIPKSDGDDTRSGLRRPPSVLSRSAYPQGTPTSAARQCFSTTSSQPVSPLYLQNRRSELTSYPLLRFSMREANAGVLDDIQYHSSSSPGSSVIPPPQLPSSCGTTFVGSSTGQSSSSSSSVAVAEQKPLTSFTSAACYDASSWAVMSSSSEDAASALLLLNAQFHGTSERTSNPHSASQATSSRNIHGRENEPILSLPTACPPPSYGVTRGEVSLNDDFGGPLPGKSDAVSAETEIERAFISSLNNCSLGEQPMQYVAANNEGDGGYHDNQSGENGSSHKRGATCADDRDSTENNNCNLCWQDMLLTHSNLQQDGTHHDLPGESQTTLEESFTQTPQKSKTGKLEEVFLQKEIKRDVSQLDDSSSLTSPANCKKFFYSSSSALSSMTLSSSSSSSAPVCPPREQNDVNNDRNLCYASSSSLTSVECLLNGKRNNGNQDVVRFSTFSEEESEAALNEEIEKPLMDNKGGGEETVPTGDLAKSHSSDGERNNIFVPSGDSHEPAALSSSSVLYNVVASARGDSCSVNDYVCQEGVEHSATRLSFTRMDEMSSGLVKPNHDSCRSAKAKETQETSNCTSDEALQQEVHEVSVCTAVGGEKQNINHQKCRGEQSGKWDKNAGETDKCNSNKNNNDANKITNAYETHNSLSNSNTGEVNETDHRNLDRGSRDSRNRTTDLTETANRHVNCRIGSNENRSNDIFNQIYNKPSEDPQSYPGGGFRPRFD